MKLCDYFKKEDSAYRYLRTGPKNGWDMSPNLYAKCPQCGYFLSLDPMKSENCPCGNLYKDSDAGRFGAKTGDATIKIYIKGLIESQPST